MLLKSEFFTRFTTELPDSNNSSSSIYFIPLNMDCLEEMHSYSIKDQFYEYFEFAPFKDIKETKSYIEKLLERMKGDENSCVTTYWFVRRKSDDRLIGSAGLIDLNFGRQSIEWGYGVDPDLWGQGYILKIQEAIKKWTSIKEDFTDINLHMIGKIQSNKVKFVVPLFDYIHSLDNLKLAEKISNEQKKYKKNIKIFIQINIGDESQKSGISPKVAQDFKNKCVNELNLNIVGLMCLPPKNKEASIYFEEMNNLLKKMNLKELSMGMSNDYLEAINYNSSYVRIGSKIFGSRDQ